MAQSYKQHLSTRVKLRLSSLGYTTDQITKIMRRASRKLDTDGMRGLSVDMHASNDIGFATYLLLNVYDIRGW